MRNPVWIAFLLVSFGCWLASAWRLGSGRDLLEFRPRRPVPWGAAQLLMTLLILVLCQAFAAETLERFGDVNASEDMRQIFSVAAGSLLALVASVVVVVLTAGASPRDLGFDHRSLLADLRLGGVAFLMLAPPVYTLQYWLVQWFPSRHPLLSLLAERGSLPVYLAVGFSAVIVAPAVEEWLFRVLLQGWIERLLLPQTSAVEEPRRTGLAEESGTTNAVPGGGTEQTFASAPGWLAIVTSAACFAGLHASHGPDPIPLFLLALGLGYLYQRTHRILPCVTVHVLLNGVTLGVFLLESW
jgi:membrane protease YdiL (CAAX protease family)